MPTSAYSDGLTSVTSTANGLHFFNYLLQSSLAYYLSNQLNAEQDTFSACTGAADFAKDVDAFFTKRAARFSERDNALFLKNLLPKIKENMKWQFRR